MSERAFHTYILKVFSRCNLNCTYCYMYNLADRSFERQPWNMSEETLARTFARVREHLDAHGKRSAHFILHGGEPLLGGAKFLARWFALLHECFDRERYDVRVGMQSNGVLLDPEICALLVAEHATVGISLDGPPPINNRFRIDHSGHGSSTRVERGLAVLTRPEHRKAFAGFLVVVDVDTDPIEIFRYLAAFEPPSIDFLLPYDNHDRRPKRKEDFESTPYGDWLVRLFDHWWNTKSTIRIREFDNIVRMLLGGRSRVESIGLEPVDIVVVETNGEIELVDSLKGTFEGATRLGFDVEQHAFDEVVAHNMVEFRRLGVDALAPACQACRWVPVCGGGYMPNRYSEANGFRNPSIYCHDLQRILSHVRTTLLQSSGAAAPAAAEPIQPA